MLEVQAIINFHRGILFEELFCPIHRRLRFVASETDLLQKSGIST